MLSQWLLDMRESGVSLEAYINHTPADDRAINILVMRGYVQFIPDTRTYIPTEKGKIIIDFLILERLSFKD